MTRMMEMLSARHGNRFRLPAPAAALVLTLGGALALGGCASSVGTGDDESADRATLRVVMAGSENETLDYGSAQSYFPWTVIGNICDSLVTTRDGVLTNSLATSVTPNEDATAWTVTIRPDATFHNGEPVTAEDVVASIRYFAASPGFSGFYSSVDVDAVSAVDQTTLRIPLTAPRSDFVETVLSAASIVYQDGEGSAETPSCSGPFELESFDQGTGAVLVRNAEHWGVQPSVERVEIRRVADATARVNALLSGDADYAFDVPATGATTVSQEDGLQVMSGGVANSNALYFVLNTRVPPLDDPVVREAIATAVDREQLVSVVLGEYGEVGNDLFGKGLDGYDDAIVQRERDIDASREVLRSAGVSSLSVTVSEVTPGLTDSVDLLGQQLAEVGVEVEVENVDPSAFFTDLNRLYSSQVIAMHALNRSPTATLPQVFGAENPYALSGWGPPELTSLVQQMQATTDDTARRDLVDQIQQLQWAQSPHLVWGYREQISAGRAGLSGVVLNLGIPLFAETRTD